jgi:hypothetical protein
MAWRIERYLADPEREVSEPAPPLPDGAPIGMACDEG